MRQVSILWGRSPCPPWRIIADTEIRLDCHASLAMTRSRRYKSLPHKGLIPTAAQHPPALILAFEFGIANLDLGLFEQSRLDLLSMLS